jgi:hypothetical protein
MYKRFGVKSAIAILLLSLCAKTMAQPVTQSLTILGANGNIGDVHAYTEASSDGGVTWGPAYLVDNAGSPHPWGLITGTTAWLNVGPAMAPYGVDQTTLYRIRFNAPSEWVNPQLDFAIKADNAATVWFNGTLAVPYFAGGFGTTVAQPDAEFAANLQPGLNEFLIELQDWGGITGLNYRIDIQMESAEPLSVVDVYEPVIVDSDDDGLADADDACVNSILSATVAINDVDSGVANTINATGCSIADLLDSACSGDFKNHGQFVSCITHAATELRKAGIINNSERSALVKAAAKK